MSRRYLRARTSRRDWEPDCILPGVTETDREKCRVCGQPIAKGETVLRRRWNDITISHVSCGWNCSRDARAVELNREAQDLVAASRGAA